MVNIRYTVREEAASFPLQRTAQLGLEPPQRLLGEATSAEVMELYRHEQLLTLVMGERPATIMGTRY